MACSIEQRFKTSACFGSMAIVRDDKDTMTAQEVGATLSGEDGLVVIAGAELVGWYQIHQTHGFHVFDAVPLAPFQPLL